MAKYIELIGADDRKWHINTKYIVSLVESKNSDGPTTIQLVAGTAYVKHSLSEVLAKIDAEL
jgi:uncharacterized protein YlzI (FlbEa/FlbD family)